MNVSELFTAVLLIFISQGFSQENLVRNKPTLQHGVIPYGYPSELAVDGVYTQTLDENSCAFVTTHGTVLDFLWWAVDMGAVYDVSHVIIYRTSIANLLDMSLEMYVTSPFLCRAGAANLCHFEADFVPIMKNFTCNSGAVGRYFMVSSPTMSNVILCEVEVYGSQVAETSEGDQAPCSSAPKLYPQVDQALDQATEGVIHAKATSRVECSTQCMERGSCLAYSYNVNLTECISLAGDTFVMSLPILPTPGWDTFTVCF